MGAIAGTLAFCGHDQLAERWGDSFYEFLLIVFLFFLSYDDDHDDANILELMMLRPFY